MTEYDMKEEIAEDISDLDLSDEGDVNILYAIKYLLETHGYDYSYNNNDDTCPNCGNHYDDCECDDQDDEENDNLVSFLSNLTFEEILKQHPNMFMPQTNTNNIAADEFAQHEYNQFKKKNNSGGGFTPQQGL